MGSSSMRRNLLCCIYCACLDPYPQQLWTGSSVHSATDLPYWPYQTRRIACGAWRGWDARPIIVRIWKISGRAGVLYGIPRVNRKAALGRAHRESARAHGEILALVRGRSARSAWVPLRARYAAFFLPLSRGFTRALLGGHCPQSLDSVRFGVAGIRTPTHACSSSDAHVAVRAALLCYTVVLKRGAPLIDGWRFVQVLLKDNWIILIEKEAVVARCTPQKYHNDASTKGFLSRTI